ncbi:MAG: hypothetical protein D6722_11355, partial [Bacteroidetes bacterium]
MSGVRKIPIVLRILVVAAYLSPGFAFGFVLPVAVYFLFERHPFVRFHSLAALWIHLLGWGLTAMLRLPSYFFVIELKQVFLTPEEFAGRLFSEEAVFTWVLLILSSAFFLASLVLLSALQDRSSRFRKRPSAGPLLLSRGWYAVFLVPALFYMQGLWGGVSDGGPFFGLDLEAFRDPSRLFPGHLVLLYSMCFSIYAWRSERPLLAPFTTIYVRLERSRRRQGPARYRSARLRSWLLPGWGQLYEGRLLTGLSTMFAFLLGLLFFWTSLCLWYGRLVENISYLNANSGWYFLGQLGLRSHGLSDRAFQRIFGTPWAMLVLFAYLAACWAYAWWELRHLGLGTKPVSNPQAWPTAVPSRNFYKHSTEMGARRTTPASGRLLSLASLGLLLHLVPVGIALLIPVTVNP